MLIRNQFKMYAASAKRQKVTRDSVKSAENVETFPGVGKVEFKQDVPYNSDDLSYRYYNANERIHGRPMEEWLRPSIFIGKAFTPYPGSFQRPWSDNTQHIDNYKKSIRAVFEFCMKVGIKFWSGYDRDIAPETDSFEETQTNFENMTDIINEYQQKTGIRPLWFGVDFKNHTRYKNGAATSADANTLACAGFQVKRGLDIAHKLNAECFLIDAGQEGYENIANTDLQREIKHYVRFLRMIVEQRDKIGYRGQLLLQFNSTDNQKYTANVFSMLAFLKHFNYDRYFKINTNLGHDFFMCNVYGSVGSIDIKGNDLINLSNAMECLRTVIENGGMLSGGLTFYIPMYSGYNEPKELVAIYITALDIFAKALKLAVKFVNDNQFNKALQMRYTSFTTGWGAKFLTSESALEECEEQVKKMHDSNPPPISSKSDHWASVVQRFIDAPIK